MLFCEFKKKNVFCGVRLRRLDFGTDVCWMCIPRTQLSSIFKGAQPSKTRPKLQSKHGAPFGFQV